MQLEHTPKKPGVNREKSSEGKVKGSIARIRQKVGKEKR